MILLWFSSFTLGTQHGGTASFLVWCLGIRDDRSVLMDFRFMNLFSDGSCWLRTIGLSQHSIPVSLNMLSLEVSNNCFVALVQIKTFFKKTLMCK